MRRHLASLFPTWSLVWQAITLSLLVASAASFVQQTLIIFFCLSLSL